MWKSCLLVLILAGSAIAQNSLTVTASRPTNATADLVVLTVDVLTPSDAGREDVFAALQGSIVTPANFRGVQTTYPTSSIQGALDWSFTVTAPLGNFKITITQLQALQQLVAQKKNGMSVSFSVAGTQLSAQAQQGLTCAVADLLSDARAQAQKMAVAAGAGVGNVLAMSGATVTQPASGSLFSSPMSVPSCTLTVKFALTGF
jgi:uncharacterized protein YggE